jgi:hypothetical protein
MTTTKQHHDDLVTALGQVEGHNRETLESLWKCLRVYSETSFQAHTFYLGPAERGRAFPFVIPKQEETKTNSDETKSKF